MFRDINISRDLNAAYCEWTADRPIAPVVAGEEPSVGRSLPSMAASDLSVHVLTTGMNVS